jgi:hypothetical protein
VSAAPIVEKTALFFSEDRATQLALVPPTFVFIASICAAQKKKPPDWTARRSVSREKVAIKTGLRPRPF